MLNIDNFALDSNLGSPNKKYMAIWFHGCGRGCAGCIAQQRNNDPEPCFTFSPEFFARMIMTDKGRDVDGFVLSGGEPFLQREDIVRFLSEAEKTAGRSLDVICYTGYKYEELMSADSSAKELLEHIDVLIDGEYRKELNNGSRYRGSSNQNLIFLTKKYSVADFPDEYSRKITISSFDVIEMKGIPTEKSETLWKAIKEEVDEYEEDNQGE